MSQNFSGGGVGDVGRQVSNGECTAQWPSLGGGGGLKKGPNGASEISKATTTQGSWGSKTTWKK